MLDTDGNIVDVSTKEVVVKSAEVKTYEAPSDKDADGTTDPPESDVKSPTSETGNNGSETSTSETSSSSSSDSSGNESSVGGSKPSGGNNSASGGSSSSGGSSGTGTSDPPAPVHTHSWQKVYRTEIVDDYETRYVSYCVCCGQDMTDWTNEQVNDHAENHVLNGESGQWRTEGKPFKIGSHEERILDHYACSCGATKPI